MRAVQVLAGLAVGAAALTGCSSGSSKAVSAPTPSTSTVYETSPAATSAAPASSAAATSAAAATGCAKSGSGVPSGAKSGPIIDVDGDGKADTGWVQPPAGDGSVTAGITTASGGTFSTRYTSASPINRTLFVFDATGKGEIVATIDDGRQATLYAISGCSFVPIVNPTGETFVFDLGFSGNGTGVGCSQTAGQSGRVLVGLNVSSDGKTISRTPVLLSGKQATIGTADSVAATSAASASARTISCGDLTASANGIHGSGS